MEDGEKQSLEQMRAWVGASGEVRFHSQDRGELYEWVNRTLRQQDYGRLLMTGTNNIDPVEWTEPDNQLVDPKSWSG